MEKLGKIYSAIATIESGIVQILPYAKDEVADLRLLLKNIKKETKCLKNAQNKCVESIE